MIKNWLHHKWLKETMTMSELLERYRQEVLLVSHLAIGTRNGYTSAIRCMHKMEISTKRVKDIDRGYLQSFFDGLSEGFYNLEGKYHKGFGKSRILAYSAVLQGSLEYAVLSLKILKSNPMQGVHLVSVRNEKTLFQRIEDCKLLKHEEYLKIIDYLTKIHNPHVLPIQISYYTGLRLGEVCALTWEDVHLEEQYLVVRRAVVLNCEAEKNRLELTSPKRDKVRYVEFGKVLKDILVQAKLQQELYKKHQQDTYQQNYYVTLRENNTTHFVLHSGKITNLTTEKELHLVCVKQDGAFINRRSLGCLCVRLNKHVEGLEDFHFHTLRHTYASNLLRYGANMSEVKELLGHEDIRTTMNVYVHNYRKDLVERVKVLDLLQ